MEKDQCVRNLRGTRKSAEAFVTWKKSVVVEGSIKSPIGPKTARSGRGGRSATSLPGSSSIGRSHSDASTAPTLPRHSRESGSMEGSRAGRRLSVGSAHATDSDGDACIRQSQLPEGEAFRNGTSGGQTVSQIGGQVCRRRELSVVTSPKKSIRSVQEDVLKRNTERRFAVLNGLRRAKERVGGTSAVGDIAAHTHDGTESPPSGGAENDEDEQEPVGEEEAENDDDAEGSFERRRDSKSVAVEFYNGEYAENGGTDEDNDKDGEDTSNSLADDGVDVDALIYPTLAERKKERRQERAILEKEGDRRRKEGLPRNFLLVDEISKIPYGVGVGDWRKELMLLSRDLDPAIGNINKQPEAAVAEIVEWIQHTWEYSSPVKFEYVKEVIARGVTLRRGELWNKIRNGEPKPSKLSDRTWRTLERQLENPASIRKSENCRRANASRVNFGRTGPSGEVGVRQRLRRILRRSPDPEEVRMEMARDKGHGGRQQKKACDLTIMHGFGGQRRLRRDVPHLTTALGNCEEEVNGEDMGNEEFQENFNDKENGAVQGDDSSGQEIIGGGVASMSTEQISKHPFVLMMMERLEALEAKNKDVVVEGGRQGPEVNSSASAKILGPQGQQFSQEENRSGAYRQSKEADATHTSKRQRKKAT